jgi:hypothetical protein
MKLENYLVVRMGRSARDYTAVAIMREAGKISELIELVKSGTKTQRMKGSWVLSGIHSIDSGVLKAYYPILLDQIRSENIGGVKRELLRCFENADLDRKIADQIILIAMELVTDARQDLAVRYLCYRLIIPLLEGYPDLQLELKNQTELYRLKFGRFP